MILNLKSENNQIGFVPDHKLPRNPFDLASNLQLKYLEGQPLMIPHVQFFFGRFECQVNLLNYNRYRSNEDYSICKHFVQHFLTGHQILKFTVDIFRIISFFCIATIVQLQNDPCHYTRCIRDNFTSSSF